MGPLKRHLVSKQFVTLTEINYVRKRLLAFTLFDEYCILSMMYALAPRFFGTFVEPLRLATLGIFLKVTQTLPFGETL